MSRVLVVGAGIAGLVAADALAGAGHAVTVVDKGRGVGGRMATRRIGAARLDHGAQFFTVRADRFATVADGWRAAGASREWCRGFAGRADGHPRFAGVQGMSTPAKTLAARLADVRVATTLDALVRTDAGGWRARLAGGGWLADGTATDGTATDDTAAVDTVALDTVALDADAVICTPPVPQTLALLAAGGVVPEPEAAGRLARIRYDPTLALLVVPAGASAVPEPGGVQLSEHPVWSWVGDNAAKGTSPVPAVTFHARPDVSAAAWDDDRDATRDRLRAATGPWVDPGLPAEVQLAAWRYATPVVLDDERCVVAAEAASGPLVCAGDAFGEARVEGAVLSGLAAADAVAERLS